MGLVLMGVVHSLHSAKLAWSKMSDMHCPRDRSGPYQIIETAYSDEADEEAVRTTLSTYKSK